MKNKYMRHTIYSLVDDSFVCQRAQSAHLTCAQRCTRIVKTVDCQNIFCIPAHKAEASLKVIDAVQRGG